MRLCWKSEGSREYVCSKANLICSFSGFQSESPRSEDLVCVVT